jgi:hypothetical protein
VNDRTEWLALIESGDAETLSARASEVLGFKLPAARFLMECRHAAESCGSTSGNPLGSGRPGSWSDCTWRTWLKNRAAALDCYQVVNPNRLGERWGSGTLHVGFLFIEESEDHMANLRRSPEPETAAGPARSRIGATDEFIRPIDRVAGAVAPTFDPSEGKAEGKAVAS